MKVKIQNEKHGCKGFKVIKLKYVEPKDKNRVKYNGMGEYICPICLELGEMCQNCRDKYL